MREAGIRYLFVKFRRQRPQLDRRGLRTGPVITPPSAHPQAGDSAWTHETVRGYSAQPRARRAGQRAQAQAVLGAHVDCGTQRHLGGAVHTHSARARRAGVHPGRGCRRRPKQGERRGAATSSSTGSRPPLDQAGTGRRGDDKNWTRSWMARHAAQLHHRALQIARSEPPRAGLPGRVPRGDGGVRCRRGAYSSGGGAVAGGAGRAGPWDRVASMRSPVALLDLALPG